jgi:hypothetical protein
MLRRVSPPLIALAVAACGQAFTAATGDGGPRGGDDGSDAAVTGGRDAAGADAASSHDATTEDAPARDANTKEGGGKGDGSTFDLDASPVLTDAASCFRACPTGFECIATKCEDRAAAHFSATDNRPFNWSYGDAQSLGGAFQLYSSSWSPTTSIDVWTSTTAHTLEPSVFHNGSLLAQMYGEMTIPGASLGLYPGAMGETSIVRWTAPSAGQYAIDVTFTGISTPPTKTNVGVLVNHSTMLAPGDNDNGSYDLNEYGGGNTFTLSVPAQTLAAGAVLDFYATILTTIDDPPGGASMDAHITAE